MILWLNGAFGSGKTTAAYELNRRLPGSYVFDPESFGFFLFENIPAECRKADFQDIPLWRETNRKLLEILCREYHGVVIVPMTLVDPVYWDEIIGELRRNGADVRHYVLYAGRDTLLKRLKKRALGSLAREQFAVDAIERCMNAFDTVITEGTIHTDSLSVDEVAEEIARLAGVTLMPRMNPINKHLERMKTWFRHIRS